MGIPLYIKSAGLTVVYIYLYLILKSEFFLKFGSLCHLFCFLWIYFLFDIVL